ncbi:glycosyltransferase family 39 protein [Aquimarina pacifica]|uniref:glycosyltransferase family 39 protein n=1 Tax=Aquimarina pacifica TaxID=1296415 RepID=UPI000471FCB2|nr:glycosyltransferase family 39 protein [Aquimarina pacifica]
MYWTQTNTNLGILFSTGVLLFHIIIFPNYIMPLPILLIGVAIILFFYTTLRGYTVLWRNTNNIKTKLFFHSLLYRILGILGMYFITLNYDPNSLPFELSAADSWNYHYSGVIVADAIRDNKNIFMSLSTFWKSESDYGFSIIIGAIYSIFGKIPYVIKLFNAIVGSFTVLRIYQITKIIYQGEQAKIAGILAMIMPPLLWFGGMFLKETILIFLLVNATYFAMKITKSLNYRPYYITLILLHFGLIFYFRVVLAPILLIAILLQMSLFKLKKRSDYLFSFLIVAGIMIGSIYVMKALHMDIYVEEAIAASSDQFGNELEGASKSRGVNYAAALVAPLLVAGAILTPFPSVLDFEASQLAIYAHFQNEVIRNGMYFFVFFGLIRAIKLKQKKTILVGSLAIIYILVLAASGISHQDRFQIISLPFLIIFMSDGIVSKYKQQQRHWTLYLILIFAIILMWNVFKLSIRQLI